MAVAEEAKLAVEPAIVRKTHQRPRQDCAPAAILRMREAALQHRVIRADEPLHEVEHRVPQPRLDCRALLIVRRVLSREIGDQRIEPRVERKQRLELRRRDVAPADREIREKLERHALGLEHVAFGKARNEASHLRGVAQRVLQLPQPFEDGIDHRGIGMGRERPEMGQLPAIVICETRTEPM